MPVLGSVWGACLCSGVHTVHVPNISHKHRKKYVGCRIKRIDATFLRLAAIDVRVWHLDVWWPTPLRRRHAAPLTSCTSLFPGQANWFGHRFPANTFRSDFLARYSSINRSVKGWSYVVSLERLTTTRKMATLNTRRR